jgi:methyl-accepting chemotaxis protein
MFKNVKIPLKLTLLFLIFGVVPTVSLGWIAYKETYKLEEIVPSDLERVALDVADMVDRNLFERYGDVQAFAINYVVHLREDWYVSGSDKNRIATAMNQYVDTYDIYYLTILVDLQGRVVAVNDRDADGQPIDTAFLYEKNFANSEWFKAVSNGRFTTRTPHTAPGNDISDGTFIEHLHIDQNVKQAYPGDNGMAIAFSAPVYEDGKVIGYWSNRTKFSLVEDIFRVTYQDLKEKGFAGAELTLLDESGRVIIDYDPTRTGSEDIQHDYGVLMKLNLANNGVTAAQEAVAGRTGHLWESHARKQIMQAAGYTHLQGALGYPGMNWSILVRTPRDQAIAEILSTRQQLFVTGGVFIAATIFLGLLIGRVATRPLASMLDSVKRFAGGDTSARVELRSGDEIGQLGSAFNDMVEEVGRAQEEVKTSLQEAAVKANVVENASTNIIVADTDFNITYINPQSLKTFKEIADVLPCKPEEIVGKNIDFFHKNPAHQRKILSDPNNLPFRTNIEIGHHTLDLFASAVYDDNEHFMGPMVTWELITEKLKLEQEAAVKANVVENTPANIIVADADFNITYINPQSLKAFKEIADVLPCKPEEVLGKNIDFFHKDPAHQRKILADPSNLPFQANIELGHHTLDLLASAVFDANGGFMGPMVTWEVITEKIRIERALIQAAENVAATAEELSRTSAQMATGSENQQVTVQGVAAAVEEMTQSARGVSDNMDELARLMTENAAALNELSSSVASVTQNADQMSQTVIANSSAIEELAASVQTQADGAQQANDTAKEASKAAEEGSQVVRQAIASMERIAERVRSSSATIGELGKSSEQISTIVAVINDIADQTNLLALNAAIEVARAGEQGKGFMVVADEVRKLAERTSQATREIDDMIRKIQTDTQEVVVSMEAGMTEVEQGTELAGKSGEALAQIGDGIGRVNTLMGQLTEASREQATTSDEIVRSTAEMNELVQQVTGAMNEQSQAVEMVSQSTEEVQSRVDQVANAMREQTETAMQIAQSMEEVNGVAGETLQSAREMDKATSELARQAEGLNELATNDGNNSQAANPTNGSATKTKAKV